METESKRLIKELIDEFDDYNTLYDGLDVYRSENVGLSCVLSFSAGIYTLLLNSGTMILDLQATQSTVQYPFPPVIIQLPLLVQGAVKRCCRKVVTHGRRICHHWDSSGL